jgi:hypothetical protein
MTIWLRETASPQTLRALLSSGLALYVGWHFAKAAFFQPESPFDWPPGQRDLLATMPLRSRDLVAYQLASVAATTIIKAGLVTLLLWPDLRCVPLGLAGLLLSMLALEMLRMALEIAIWGMGRMAYGAYRAFVVAGLTALGVGAAAVISGRDSLGTAVQRAGGPFHGLLEILIQLDASVFSYAALPFQPLIDLAVAESMTSRNLAILAAALGALAGSAAAIIGLHAATCRRVARREKRNYRPKGAARESLAGAGGPSLGSPRCVSLRSSWRRIPHWGGVGALAWRQLIGARRYWGSLVTAMIAPAVLAWTPCFVIEDAYIAYLSTTGALAFYTFLLLPTALRFDFRRDLDRLATLKGLPITPAAAAIGQVLAPVLIATLFQTGVLALALVGRSLPAHYLLTTMLVMVPLSALVFGLDNLIYLLYPYRIQQEGLEIFLRTMLTFTGKGLLFALGLGAMSAWGFAAAALTQGISQWIGAAINAYAVFAAGMVVGPSFLAALVLYALSRTYANIDPAEDVARG